MPSLSKLFSLLDPQFLLKSPQVSFEPPIFFLLVRLDLALDASCAFVVGSLKSTDIGHIVGEPAS